MLLCGWRQRVMQGMFSLIKWRSDKKKTKAIPSRVDLFGKTCAFSLGPTCNPMRIWKSIVDYFRDNWARSWEKLFMPHANNKGANQHSRSLISTFVVRCLTNIIPPVSISEISSLYLAFVAAHAGLILPWLRRGSTGPRFFNDSNEDLKVLQSSNKAFFVIGGRNCSLEVIWAATWQNQQNDCAHSEDSD